MTIQRLPKALCCLILGVTLYVSPALAQIGAISNVGATATEMDAITFDGGLLYGATGGAGALYTIDPTSGAATLVHAFVGASNASLTYGVNGLAFQPPTGILYGTTSPDSPNSGNSLVTINPATGQVTVIGPSGTSYPYTNIAFAANGTLYGWLISSNAGATEQGLASINLTTGAGTYAGNPQAAAIVPYIGLAISGSGAIYVTANGHGGAPSCGGSCSGAFWTVDPATGSTTTVGTLSGGPGVAPAITALAFSPSGNLYGIEGGYGGGWNLILITVPPFTGAISNIGTAVTEMDAITFNSSGVLYGATGSAGALYTINPTTGAATLVHALVGASNTSLTYGVNGLAFQAGTGTLYGTTSPDSPNSGNSLVTINPATGQVTVIGPSGTGYPYTNIAFAPNGTLYGWLVSSNAGSPENGLATINRTTGAGTYVGSPQAAAIIPYIGLAISGSGVIYVAANGHRFAPSCGGSCSGAFWTVDPATGSTTTIGTFYGGPGVAPAITALAFSPTGALYGIEGGDGGGWNLILISLPPVAGDLISYEFTTTLSGTLGASSFTNAVVTLTLTGNTSGIMGSTSQLGFLLNPGTTTVSIAGLGTAILTDPIAIFSTYQTLFDGLYGVLLLDTNSGTGILYQAGSVFYGYQLGPFGTVSGTGGPASGSQVQSYFPTTKGELSFIYASASGTSTFTASLQTSSTAACDITGDTTTSVTDVQAEVSEALGIAPALNDLNGDGVVNVADLQVVANSVLNLGCTSHGVTSASSHVSPLRTIRQSAVR